MCHMSPTAQMLGLLVTVITTCFNAWHMWCFDHGRCLLFTRRDAFRWIILVMLIAALCAFTFWSGALTWVKYQEYYGVIKHPDGSTSIGPVPWQMWPADRQNLIRAGYHVVSVGWALLISVHAEEILYWAYLIGSIRNRDSRTWIQSKYFKIWVLCIVTFLGTESGVANIETRDLNQMEHYIFFSGSLFATMNVIGSLWLFMVFPGFIQESGANPDVLGRLQYFKELNSIRTIFRFFCALCLLTLSVDAWTKHKAVNMSPFWTDVTFTMAYFCALTSTAIAVMILLPRSMAGEAGGAKQAHVYVQNTPHHLQAYRKSSLPLGSASYPPTIDVEYQPPRTAGPWTALGDRLNVDSVYPVPDDEGQTKSDGGNSGHVPFAAQPGSRRLADGETIPHVPVRLNEFRGPLAVNQPRRPVDLNIVVLSETIVEKD